ncbi:MAG: hypothetical protein HY072_09245 [Deltaproteobacteria bacterium]|nr:hypothetical protein [Deltaproteobacteria bacterium]
MTKTIAKKDLYRQLKMVSDDVVKNGTVYTVIQNSKPSFYIVPLESFQEKKKYRREDMLKGIFRSKHPEEKNLATTYKKYLYG